LQKKFPFNIIDYLANNRGSNRKRLISGPDNNEGYPTEMKGWYPHNVSTHGFDEEEFKTLCEHYLLPPTSSFQRNVTVLFVPDTLNFPSDFFLWDSHRQLMMGFQVTVLNPITDHPKMTNSQIWQRFCFGNSKQTLMELYWVAPKCCTGTNTSLAVNDSIIFFDDLIPDFPALRKLVLQ
jgi:hypothetical protein